MDMLTAIWSCVKAMLSSEFVAAVAGGAVGGLFTYLGVKKTIENESNKIRLQGDSEVRAFCKAIETELECLLDRYIHSIGDTLGKHNNQQPFVYYYPLSDEYFTVFNSNAHLLGRVNDDELRTSIVQVYTKAKGHLDSFRYNNELVTKFQENFFRANHTGNKFDIEQRDLYYNQLKQYAPALLSSHSDLVTLIEKVVRRLKMGT